MIYSIQLKNTANAIHYADIWLRYNGSDYPDSTTRFHVPARKSSSEFGYAVATVNFVGTSVAPGDYVELWWHADSTSVSIEYLPAGVSPVHPATPSVIATFTQVMYTQLGPTGATGPTGTQGVTGPTGSSAVIQTQFKQNVNVTHTGTTANTIVASYLIPSGTFQANDFFRFLIQTSHTNNANVKTLRVYINSSVSLTSATLIATRLLTSSAGASMARDLIFKNSLSSQDISSVTNNSGDNENNTNVTVSSLTINFSVNQYFIVAFELADGTDSAVIRGLRTNIFR
jgi:hypothetical protein